MNPNHNKKIICLVVCFLILSLSVASCKIIPDISDIPSDELSSSHSDASSDVSGPQGSDDVSQTQSQISDDISGSEDISSSSSEPAQVTPEPTCIPEQKIYVIEGIANLREGPSTVYNIIKQLSFGAELSYTSYSGEWIQVTSGGETTGYIHSSLVSETKPDTTNIPTVIPVPDFPVWPAEFLVTGSYDPELDRFIGRYKGEGYLPLDGICVIIDPGHGGKDTGAVYYNPGTGRTIYEKTFNMEISQKLSQELKDMGAEVILTRETDEYTGLYKRSAMINMAAAKRLLDSDLISSEDRAFVEGIVEGMQEVIDANSDAETFFTRGIMHGIGVNADFRKFLDLSSEVKDMIFVSVHCNSFPQDKSVNGAEIYYGHQDSIRAFEENWLKEEPDKIPVYPSYSMFDHASRSRLAMLVRDKISEGTDLDIRKCFNSQTGASDGVFPGDFCVIRENRITGFLLDVGFLTKIGRAHV